MSTRHDAMAAAGSGSILERRAVPRIAPKRPLVASVLLNHVARIIDISSRGAQVEVQTALPPSGTCDLRIRFDEGEFAAHATVRRCTAVARKSGSGGQDTLLFRAGLEFHEVGPESLAWLSSNVLFAEA